MSDTPDADAYPPDAEPLPGGAESLPGGARPEPSDGGGAEDPAGEVTAASTAVTGAEAEEPSPVAGGPGSPRRTRLRLEAMAGALVLALVAGGAAGGWALGWWGASAQPAAGPTATPTPTGSPAVSPFAGTPAEDFAEGAAGIVLPEPEAVGEFTAEEVAEALEQVRRALIAARLDETMLIDHNPDEFLSLLAPDQQESLGDALEAGEFGPFPSRLAPEAELASVAPRVSGSVTYEATTAERDLPVLEVSTRFIWVYAFQGEASGDVAGFAVVWDDLVWQRAESLVESSQGLWLYTVESHALGFGCDGARDRLLRPVQSGLDIVLDAGSPPRATDDC